jgi:hypothetical protein
VYLSKASQQYNRNTGEPKPMEQTTNEANFEITAQVAERQGSFDQMLTDAVDDAFSILGNQAKAILCNYLKENRGITLQKLSTQIEEFAVAVEQIFGESARLLEIKIIHNLHNMVPSFSYMAENDETLSFVGYVEALRLFCS